MVEDKSVWVFRSFNRPQPADGSGWSDTLRAHAPSVRRGYVPAEQGITPANYLLFTITTECNIEAGAIGDEKLTNEYPLIRPQSAVKFIPANWKRGRQVTNRVFAASNCARRAKIRESHWPHFLLGANLLWARLRTFRTIILQPYDRPQPAIKSNPFRRIGSGGRRPKDTAINASNPALPAILTCQE